jgi:hypothetical protein
VLCVTHLPQLAAFGKQHYRVQKHVHGGRTTTQVEALQGEARVLELAAMMGEVGEGTRQSALVLSCFLFIEIIENTQPYPHVWSLSVAAVSWNLLPSDLS